jgi:hypothetical protein
MVKSVSKELIDKKALGNTLESPNYDERKI